jgi:uncharacterized protein YkwD
MRWTAHWRLGALCGALLAAVTALVAVYLAQSGGTTGPSHAGQAVASVGQEASQASQALATNPPTASVPASASTPSPTPTPTPSPTPKPTPTPTPSLSQQTAAASQVLALINQARAQAGLPPYTLSSGLNQSSAAHNARMADGCGLSHQCPGEPSLGARETAAGVNWTSAGENIGDGGPVPDSSAGIAQMAVRLTRDMLNERPPDDGHRQNILSRAFHHIGISVIRDGSGTVWMTQDFSN